MAKDKKDSKIIRSKVKLKKFNLKEELLENGWTKPTKEGGYKTKAFGAFEYLWSGLGISALSYLTYYRGFLNFSVESLSIVPVLVLLFATVALGEGAFHFLFLHGRHKALNFWKETVPYKTISFIVGGLIAFISPVTALAIILAGLIVPFLLNHAYANKVTKDNFDRRARYYEPHKYEVAEPTEYEEPVTPQPGYVPPKIKLQKGKNQGEPKAFLAADINGPQISMFGPAELEAHAQIQNSALLDQEFADTTLDLNVAIDKTIKFIEKNF